MKTLTQTIISLIIMCFLCSWGFYAHKLINEHAVYSLPTEIAIFYKKNLKIITEKATDADKRCYLDTIEGPKHYIDLDEYEDIDSIPIHWSKAKEKFTERKLLASGIIPWQINRTYNNLIDAFTAKNYKKIIQYSADLGHYIADAHVPLHTTSNYNGQQTNQIGIHAFWETRLVEMFADSYDPWVGAAIYIENPLEATWKVVQESNSLVDSVLSIEKNLSQQFKSSEIRAYIQRNNQIVFTYSDPYTIAYHQALQGMVEKRYRQSIHFVASMWYSAWVDAGQPNLSLIDASNTAADSDSTASYLNTKNLGREEWH